ncbi:unnamed protein product [Mytilus edulis]|uniref:Uncharacterized protein n=1 Tax=Mytilus edulis TaxID=6550 RepID=A0A8S3Q2F3_MYTED|nr:unnamed protein product [Mytilus edulis]
MPRPHNASGLCGRHCKYSWICDPCQILNSTAADGIDEMLFVVKPPELICGWLMIDEGLENLHTCNGVGPSGGTYHAKTFANRLRKYEWNFETKSCGNNVVIFLSRYDRQIGTEADVEILYQDEAVQNILESAGINLGISATSKRTISKALIAYFSRVSSKKAILDQFWEGAEQSGLQTLLKSNTEIVNKIFDIQDEDVVDPEEQEEAAEAHLPQPDRILNVEPVFPSLPPISPTPKTPICTPPSSPSLPSPPQFEVDYPAPPSLPSTPPQLSLEDVLDDSFVLPPPPPSPTVFSDEDLDATLPMPPPEVMCTEVLSKPIPVQQIPNLTSATPASPGVSIT